MAGRKSDFTLAQTKDMPYGVYTVHQTKGWEGREFMKDFDVFISQDGQTYRYLINNGEYQRSGSGYRSCLTRSVFCCRCGSHLRKFYRCKETGTRIKAVYPLCHCQRCDYLRAGAYACPVRHRTRYDFNHYDICGIRYAQSNNLTC